MFAGFERIRIVLTVAIRGGSDLATYQTFNDQQ
jgi:hypothetical protein